MMRKIFSFIPLPLSITIGWSAMFVIYQIHWEYTKYTVRKKANELELEQWKRRYGVKEIPKYKLDNIAWHQPLQAETMDNNSIW